MISLRLLTVNHKILLKKLSCIGIRGLPYKWFQSYLSDRMQYTSVTSSSYNSSTQNTILTESKSPLVPVKCGVPQGSILGPLLFNIYINDLPHISNSANYVLYADDTNIILSSNHPPSLDAKLNSVLSNTISWFENNNLTLNTNKTNYMHVKPKSHYAHDPIIPNNYNINNTTETTFLGVSITPDLTWKNHILRICNKIKPAIAMLYKLRNTLPAHSLLQIYFSLIHSHISYAILVWGNSPPTHLTNILKLQKKAIRLIANVAPRTSCRPLFIELLIVFLRLMVTG